MSNLVSTSTGERLHHQQQDSFWHLSIHTANLHLKTIEQQETQVFFWCFKLWLYHSWYEIFICGLLQGWHAVKKALIWQGKQMLMSPDNQWRHWWQCVVAQGSELFDGLGVNNEWGVSWLIRHSTGISMGPRARKDNTPTTQLSPPSCRTGRIAASQQGEGHGVNQYSPLTMKKVAFKHMNEWDQRLQEGLKEAKNLSLSLRSKCLACLSGTQGCTNTHKQTEA